MSYGCILISVSVTLRTNSDTVFRCAFYVVWCPKYRRRVLDGRIEERLKELIREVISEKGAWPVELEVMPDPVHLLVEVDPPVRGPQAGQGRQGPYLPCAAPGVPVAEVPAAHAVDELLLRRHGR